MYEFLKDNYFIPLYGITLAVSLIRYKRYYSSFLKYFPILIAYTLLSEILGYFIRDFESFQIIYEENYHFANYIVFNIYDVVFFLYFYLLFSRVVKDTASKRIIKYGALAYILSAIINPFFQNALIFPQIYASTLGSIILIIDIFLYYNEIRTHGGKKYNLLAWICAGILVFNFFFPLISILARLDNTLYQKLYLRQVHYIIIVIMYSCFILGFLFMRRIQSPENNKM